MEENKKNINITYETLFDLLMRERSRDELQELPEKFFNDVVEYLTEKKRILEDKSGQSELFADVEKEKTEKQLQNIKRILTELYDRREKKIINIAINKSRTQSNIVDTSTLLREEKELYDFLVYVLNKYRLNIINNVVKGRLPEVKEIALKEREKKQEQKIEVQSLDEEKKEEISDFKSGEQVLKEKEDKETKMIKFIHAVPQFLGKEFETYGPFEEEDVANLPLEIAEVLIRKGRADEIKEE